MTRPRAVAVTIAAIAAVALVECVALWRGIDGQLMSLVIAALAGLGGWSARALQKP